MTKQIIKQTVFNYENGGVQLNFTLSDREQKIKFLKMLEEATKDLKANINNK